MVIFAYFIIYLIIFMYGSSIGSFLNVLVYRIPLNISIAKGRSYCPNCKTQIKNYDLVPIFSYINLGGKCRSCNNKISLRYPMVEMFTGVIAIITFISIGLNIKAMLIFFLASILIVIGLIDLDTMTIPNELIIALIPVSIALVFFQGNLDILDRVIGFFEVSLPMYILNIFIKDSFGGGDIKLIAVCGALLGWENTLLAAFIAIIIAGTYASYLLISGKSKKGAHIAFGPYLCLGIYVSLLYGDKVISWYLALFGL